MTDLIALQFAVARSLLVVALKCVEDAERLILAAQPRPARPRPHLVVDNPPKEKRS